VLASTVLLLLLLLLVQAYLAINPGDSGSM
jgi:hypothetical protein